MHCIAIIAYAARPEAVRWASHAALRLRDEGVEVLLDTVLADELPDDVVARCDVRPVTEFDKRADIEEAQYSTAFPAAVAAVRGTIAAKDITEAAFSDPEIRRLAEGMLVTESDAYNSAFPARRFAHAVLVLRDGTRLQSPPTEARGDPEAMVSRDEMRAKYHACADPVIGAGRAIALRKAAEGLGHGQSAKGLLDLATTGP